MWTWLKDFAIRMFIRNTYCRANGHERIAESTWCFNCGKTLNPGRKRNWYWLCTRCALSPPPHRCRNRNWCQCGDCGKEL